MIDQLHSKFHSGVQKCNNRRTYERLGGLEYFVDVALELDVRLEGLDLVRVGRVTKSNSPSIPLGLELRNPCFQDLLERVAPAAGAHVAASAQVASPGGDEGTRPAGTCPAGTCPAGTCPAGTCPAGVRQSVATELWVTLDLLLQAAEAAGFSRAQLVLAASHYHKKGRLETLTPEEMTDLLTRLREPRAPFIRRTQPASRTEPTHHSNLIKSGNGQPAAFWRDDRPWQGAYWSRGGR